MYEEITGRKGIMGYRTRQYGNKILYVRFRPPEFKSGKVYSAERGGGERGTVLLERVFICYLMKLIKVMHFGTCLSACFPKKLRV
jgi:hypothetical protein